MRSTIYFIAFVLAIAAMRASWVEYGASLDDFLSSRDVVFKGVVQSVRDIDQRPEEQIATIEILEVLKNERKIAEIHKNRTLDIVVPSVKSDIRLAGRFYHDPGVKGIWMLCSTCKNYGMETDRAVESLAYEDRIREAIGKPGRKRANQPPLQTPASSTPAASASAKATADKGALVAPPSGAAGR